MTTFLDTDVLIECLRGTSSAQEWLTRAASEAFLIPGIVAMELVVGCQNQADLQRTRTFLSSFEVVWPDATEFAKAYELLIAHFLAPVLASPIV